MTQQQRRKLAADSNQRRHLEIKMVIAAAS